MEQDAESGVSLIVFGLAEPLKMSGVLENSNILVRSTSDASGETWQMTGTFDDEHKLRGQIQKRTGNSSRRLYDMYAERIEPSQ